MTPRDDAYARRLLELCRMEREGAISDLLTDQDFPVKTADGGDLGMVRVWFRYRIAGKGIHWELPPGQAIDAVKAARAIYRGFTIAEVAA